MSATVTPGPTDWQAEWPSEPAGPPLPRPSRLNALKSLPAMVIMFLLAAIAMKTFLVQVFYIPSESMEPTLFGCNKPCNGDRVVVNRLVYRVREPRRGEIVVFIAEKSSNERSFGKKVVGLFTDGLGITPPDERDFIKRIIGLPGDTVQVTANGVYVTPAGTKKKHKLVEPYIKLDGGTNGSLLDPFTVPKNMYFVMGDNRNNSSDSRTSLGPIRRADLIGKAFVLIYPGTMPGQSLWERFGRIGTLVEGEYPPTLAVGVPASAVVLPLGLLAARRRAKAKRARALAIPGRAAG